MARQVIEYFFAHTYSPLSLCRYFPLSSPSLSLAAPLRVLLPSGVASPPLASAAPWSTV